MDISLQSLKPDQVYYLMTQVVIPRPIAWVLSANDNGSLNLAPYSYFNVVASNPATIMISAGIKPDGTRKDTRENILARNHFVIHIPSTEDLDNVADSAQSLPQGESELEKLGLETVAFNGFSLPRLAHCPIALACEYDQSVEIGERHQTLILGRVLAVHVADKAITAGEGRYDIDPKAVDPLSRLGKRYYGGLGELMERERKA